MSSYEILPIERQLDSLIADNFGELAEFLADTFEENGTFVDAEFESRFPDMLYIVDAIVRSANISGTGVNTNKLYTAVYEAIYFAYSAARAVLPSGYPGVRVSDYYNDAPEVLFDKIVNSARTYSLDRPAAAGLVKAFITSIDTSAEHYELAESVAAVTLMHIEADEREQYINQQASEFMAEITEWNDGSRHY
jgi:hypothetical protein